MKNEFDYLNEVNIDFSVYEISELNEKEKAKMKRLVKKHNGISKKKIFGIAAAAAVIAALSVTGFAGDFMYRIVKSISTGHNTFTQMDYSDAQIPLPEELQGLLFDENGKKVKTFKNNTAYYDKGGNEITDYESFIMDNMPENGVIVYIDENGNEVKIGVENEKDPLKSWESKNWNIIYDESKINDAISFEAYLPEYLPDGFTFKGAAADKENGYYLFVYYENAETGKYFTLHERLLNDETAIEAGTSGTIEEITINGHTAVLSNNSGIDFEIDGVLVDISGMGVLTRDELIKVGESVK